MHAHIAQRSTESACGVPGPVRRVDAVPGAGQLYAKARGAMRCFCVVPWGSCYEHVECEMASRSPTLPRGAAALLTCGQRW